MIKCIIVDDEPLGGQLIASYADKVNHLEVLGTFTNPLEAHSFLQDNDIDLIFLDIQMPELSGVQLAKLIGDSTKVIFTTAYPQYAVEGFELKAIDYLVKPISLTRFLEAVSRMQLPEGDTTIEVGDKDYIFIKTEYRHQKVLLQDILFLKSMGDYVQVVTAAEKIMTLERMKTFENDLPQSQFVRVHRSYIVSIGKIDFIERNRIRIREEVIPLGTTYADAFWDIVNG